MPPTRARLRRAGTPPTGCASVLISLTFLLVLIVVKAAEMIAPTAMLSVRNVSKSYGGLRPRQVLRDITLEVARREYVAIMGESGAGKSTLLNLIAGLDRPDAGEILLDGRSMTGL